MCFRVHNAHAPWPACHSDIDLWHVHGPRVLRSQEAGVNLDACGLSGHCSLPHAAVCNSAMTTLRNASFARRASKGARKSRIGTRGPAGDVRVSAVS